MMSGVPLAWRLAGGFAIVGGLTLAGTSFYLDSALRSDAASRADGEIAYKRVVSVMSLASIDRRL